MEIDELIREARAGRFRPVHVVTGSERFLVERAVKLLKVATVGDGPRGFNDDVFHGKGLLAQSVLRAAKTVPMMAPARFVLVRDVDEVAAAELDQLAAYVLEPSPTTCFVATAEKLDGRTRFAKAVQKAGALSEAKEMKGAALRTFALREAKDRGHTLAPDAADALADAIGADLGALDDALERLSLYVGAGRPIGLDAVEACITRVRVDSIFALVDAVSAQDGRTAIRATRSLLADREPPLRILAMLARQIRIVGKMRDALDQGLRGPDATKAAGAPPFKARELEAAARRFGAPAVQAAFRILAETDLALKGSRVPPEVVLEATVLALCGAKGLTPVASNAAAVRRR
jgi:DNA polymerase-3 subunit delta